MAETDDDVPTSKALADSTQHASDTTNVKYAFIAEVGLIDAT